MPRQVRPDQAMYVKFNPWVWWRLATLAERKGSSIEDLILSAAEHIAGPPKDGSTERQGRFKIGDEDESIETLPPYLKRRLPVEVSR